MVLRRNGRRARDRLNLAELGRWQRCDEPPEVLSLVLREASRSRLSGSVGVVCAHEHSGLVRRARDAAQCGDAAGFEEIFQGPTRIAGGWPHVIRVTYHDTSIAEGPLGDEGLRVLLPFAGGALDQAGFLASTYVPSGGVRPALTTLVVVCQPVLSALERRVVDRLRREVDEIHPRPVRASTEVERLLELRRQIVLAGREP